MRMLNTEILNSVQTVSLYLICLLYTAANDYIVLTIKHFLVNLLNIKIKQTELNLNELKTETNNE